MLALFLCQMRITVGGAFSPSNLVYAPSITIDMDHLRHLLATQIHWFVKLKKE